MFERRFRRFEPGGAGATAYMTQPLARAFDKDDLIPVPHGAAPMPVGRPGPRLLVRTLDRLFRRALGSARPGKNIATILPR